jgi:hypothetical protein
MDFRHWLSAREAKWMKVVLTATKSDTRQSAEMRRLSTQNKNRRQRFDKRLLAWVNEFGPLGLRADGGPDIVDTVMKAAHAVRAWVAPESHRLPRRGGGTFLLDDSDYAEDINEAAGQCTRDPVTGDWVAPTLWAAMCHSVQHAQDYGWQFAECAAADCHNVFLLSRSDQIMCSQRCGKRARDHRQTQTG